MDALAFAAILSIAGATYLSAEAFAGGAPTRRDDDETAAPRKRSKNARAESGRVELAALRQSDFLLETENARMRVRSIAKRCFDIVAASVLLIFLAPLLIVTAALVRFDSRGPVIFRQERVGLNGQTFQMLKIRSMHDNAEDFGARWAAPNDPRVTRVGRWIRKLRIDEIPQAVNVLRGDMSFIGPRPERPEFVSLLQEEIPHYHLRHLVKPGITGWAQVRFHYGASIEDAREKLRYDLYYIKHFSLLREALILVLTMRVALLGLGGR